MRAAPHLQQLPATHDLCYACMVFTLQPPTMWRAVAGWVPDEGRHCALKFAAADKITHLLVESATTCLAGADIPGVVRFRGLLDCAAALPPSEHASQNTFLMQFLRGLPEHLARGAGCVVMDLFDSSLAEALNRRALACGTRERGYSAAPVKNPRSTGHACSAAQGPQPCSITLMAYGGQMLTALRDIHNRLHTHHRDIKPGNLLVAGKGADARLVFADFGLAQWAYPRKSNEFLHMCVRAPETRLLACQQKGQLYEQACAQRASRNNSTWCIPCFLVLWLLAL